MEVNLLVPIPSQAGFYQVNDKGREGDGYILLITLKQTKHFTSNNV